MLDLFGTLFAATFGAVLVLALTALAPLRPAVRTGLRLGALAWAAAILILSQSALGPGSLGPLPPALAPFSLLLGGLGVAWRLHPGFRSALLAIPLQSLILLHAGRVGGVLFLLLAAEQRLAAPFALSAGIGDIVAGALALVLASLLTGDARVPTRSLRLWNLFGALDLAAALALGALSVPGTRLGFLAGTGDSSAMATLPWLMMPGMIVPLLLLIHLTIAAKLRREAPAARILQA